MDNKITEQQFLKEADEMVESLNKFLIKYNKGIVGFNFISLNDVYQFTFGLNYNRFSKATKQVDIEE